MRKYPFRVLPIFFANRDSKASVPKAKTVRWTVFSESDAETCRFIHAAESECELLALNKHTVGAPVKQGLEGGNVTLYPIRETNINKRSYRHSRVQMRR